MWCNKAPQWHPMAMALCSLPRRIKSPYQRLRPRALMSCEKHCKAAARLESENIVWSSFDHCCLIGSIGISWSFTYHVVCPFLDLPAFGCSELGLSRMRAARVWRSMVSCETAPEDHFPKDSDSWSNPRWTWRGEILQKFLGATWSHKNNILHGKARGTYITALTTWTRM